MKRLIILFAAMSSTLAIAVSAVAAKGPPQRVGETEAYGNNLSVPAIFVPSVPANFLRVSCTDAGQYPSGDRSTLYSGYWLQKTAATWSASCRTASSASVIADWGDNLTTAPSVRTNKPIRVEVSLLDPAATGMTGYVITNLTPSEPDRLATYGTDGTSFTTGNAGAPETRVWDAGAHLLITNISNPQKPVVVVDTQMSAELNSTGGVVYGFNWGSKGRVNTPAPGTYRLTFTTSDATTFTGVADGSALNKPVFDTHSTSLTVTLLSGAGGGGGGGNRGGSVRGDR